MSKPSASLELSTLEIDVLQLLANGLRIHQVAVALYVSKDTVKLRLKRAYIKLGARNMSHAVALAWQAGLIE
jgi:DNA-binding NarL/FixJ family response regulator